MAIDIVDFPIKNGGSFHSYVAVYQTVYAVSTVFIHPEFCWANWRIPHGVLLKSPFRSTLKSLKSSNMIQHISAMIGIAIRSMVLVYLPTKLGDFWG